MSGSRAAAAVGPIRRADALGWASSALGTPMLLTPRRLLRAIGVRDDRRAVAWTLLVGVREHAATLNTIANRQRRIGMWSRVAGDTMDLALLAGAFRIRRTSAPRLLGAAALVGGLLVLDARTALELRHAEGMDQTDGSRSGGRGARGGGAGAAGPGRVRTALTIRRPEDEVRSAFRAFPWSAFDARALEASGAVRFVPAPGDRGTEVHLDHRPRVPGGALGRAAATLLGRAPQQRIHDELRRFKALAETGVVARSETSPEGPSARRQIWHKRTPAQPAGTAA